MHLGSLREHNDKQKVFLCQLLTRTQNKTIIIHSIHSRYLCNIHQYDIVSLQGLNQRQPDTTRSIVFNVTRKMAYKKVMQLELTLSLYSQRIKRHLKVGHVPLFLEHFIQSLTFDVIIGLPLLLLNE